MRLIDADILFNDIEFRTINCQNDLSLEDLEWIKEEIDQQPTAYDIDKVVEELEKSSRRYTKKYTTPYGNKGYKDSKAVNITNAIEIVKAGGKNE